MNVQCVYLCAPNDRNGNPRRAWVFTDMSQDMSLGRFREVFFEGYEGAPTFWSDRERESANGAMRINVSVKEWKRLTFKK